MEAHAKRQHGNDLPGGGTSSRHFVLNGQPPNLGAPYAEPGIDLKGTPIFGKSDGKETNVRRYKAVDIQLDVVLNKKGWHYPQQRIQFCSRTRLGRD